MWQLVEAVQAISNSIASSLLCTFPASYTTCVATVGIHNTRRIQHLWDMSLVQHPPKAPSRRRGGKGKSSRHLKRRAPLPPGKGAEEKEEDLNKVVAGREDESWYQNYQRPPSHSSQMKERIQQFSNKKKEDHLKKEKREDFPKPPLPKPTMSFTPIDSVLEPKVWTPQVEVCPNI